MKTPLGIAIVKSGSTSSGFDYYFDTKIRLMNANEHVDVCPW
jgi:hypothetical protein